LRIAPAPAVLAATLLAAAVALPAAAMHALDPQRYADAGVYLVSGGLMLGAWFIATDPVTAPATPRGCLYYGLMIGCIAYIIRAWGGYPDGFAFAVLIANSASPLIAHYTRPRVLGELP